MQWGNGGCKKKEANEKSRGCGDFLTRGQPARANLAGMGPANSGQAFLWGIAKAPQNHNSLRRQQLHD
jgi:hypothetical protein